MSRTITVTPDTFTTAVAKARSGDTLAFVGTFGKIRIINRKFASVVTIDATQATFTNTFTLANDSNLNIAGGTYNIAGAPNYTQAVSVYGGRNIKFTGMTVIGTAGGEGVLFNGTTGATVMNSTFTGLQVGIVLGSVTTGIAAQNTITGAVSDGIDIANSHGVTASSNSCSGGNPGAGVHPDCVQLWSITGHALQSNIIVRDNSASGPTQGFTAFSSMGGEDHVQIINNVLKTSYPQGVACYDCTNSSISHNHLATLRGSPYLTNLNVVGGYNNTVVGNVIIPKPAPTTPSGAALGFAVSANIAADEFDDTPDLALLVGPVPTDLTAAAIPEPGTWVLLATGFAAVGVARRRRYERV